MKWRRRLLEFAEQVATWSKDPSTRVGAVIADYDHRIISTGFNGFPRGVFDTPERLADRETKYRFTVHAEVNAILSGRDVTGADIYCTVFPCAECAKFIIQAGLLSVVVYLPEEKDSDFVARWRDDQSFARQMFHEAEIQVIEIQR